MEYLEIPCCKGPGFKIAVRSLIHREKSAYQDIAVYDTDPFGRCLILDGDIQTAETDHEVYDKVILKRLSAENSGMLILGGGDGYVAEMALKLNPQIGITLVELDGAVVRACKTHLSQDIYDHPKVKLVVDDAFHFMEKAGNGGYDGIVCDLTDFPVGYNYGKFRGFYEKVFTLSAKILKAGGWISVYAGNNAGVLAELLKKDYSAIEQMDISIPSFGECCSFLYGER